MQERSFDEMIAYFNRRVADMDISQDCKMELLGMVTALGYKHEKTAQHWIPCSERHPEEKSDWKNVLVVDESGDSAFKYSSVGFYLNNGCWIVDNEPMEEESTIRVIAWMPLPEPYKGVTE